jgi:hypothetical protein
MPRRNRLVSFLLIPIGVVFWLVGWSLYWIGLKRESKTQKPKMPHKKQLTFFVPTPEQKCAT